MTLNLFNLKEWVKTFVKQSKETKVNWRAELWGGALKADQAKGTSADQIHSPCSEITPASAGSSSDLRCCGLACLRRDMLLALVVAMLLRLRSEMCLRFADTSAKSEWINTQKVRKQSGGGERERGREKKYKSEISRCCCCRCCCCALDCACRYNNYDSE